MRKLILNTSLLSLVCLGLVLSACATVAPPTRTLPEHVRRVYIPEFRNTSRTYGLQADLTLFVNDEFISDGRLDVVQNDRADVRLEGRIKSYRDFPTATSGDRFPYVSLMEMTCIVEMWDPYDTDRVAPIARYTVSATVQYISDARRSLEETQTEARERLLRQMARNIVNTVMYGASETLKPLEQKAIGKFRERHSTRKQEPVMAIPRFPKPTPVQ